MVSRRTFLRQSSIISFTPLLPAAFANAANFATPKTDDKVLVVIQLNGGNDGLNTVVPFADDNYARARKKLRLETKRLHRLDDHSGLHPSMQAAKELFDEDRMAIVQGVGYPNPDRSHFRSMKIWQTANLDAQSADSHGWLGRTLDQQLAASERQQAQMSSRPNAVYVGQQDVPPALWSRRSEAISLSRLDDLKLAGAVPIFSSNVSPAKKNELNAFVARQSLAAFTSAKELESQLSDKSSSAATYPKTKLASRLKLVARMLQSGSPTRIFYTDQSGYDTHSTQRYTHSRLLREYSDAVKAFLDDLKAAKLEDRVVVMAFSEFGRRVFENDSGGTDHGTAGPVFLFGSPVKGGMCGEAPDLSDLKNGDIKVQTDFRSVYSTILQNWLDVEPDKIIDQSFEQLPLF